MTAKICSRCPQEPTFKVWSKSGQSQLRYQVRVLVIVVVVVVVVIVTQKSKVNSSSTCTELKTGTELGNTGQAQIEECTRNKKLFEVKNSLLSVIISI